MPNRNTFTIVPIVDLLGKYIHGTSIDPFANESKVADITNDIDEQYETDYNMHALDFLELFDDKSIDTVILDPPYSPTQISVVYKKLKHSLSASDTEQKFYGSIKDESRRILTDDGVVISFGWNTNGMGKTRGFSVVEILIVYHGGNHNDTLVTVEKKTPLPLFSKDIPESSTSSSD